MRQPGIKLRWILSPMETLEGKARPICAEYSLRCHWPMELAGKIALCHCEMMASQLVIARKDTRIWVMESMHCQEPIPVAVATALASYGITASMTVAGMLRAMAAHHIDFDPEI